MVTTLVGDSYINDNKAVNIIILSLLLQQYITAYPLLNSYKNKRFNLSFYSLIKAYFQLNYFICNCSCRLQNVCKNWLKC